MSGWGMGYLAEGARGSAGPNPPLTNREQVSSALAASMGGTGMTGTEQQYTPEMDTRECGWETGDPCGVCGSTDTHWGEATEGAFCGTCGAMDSDDD